MALVAYYVPGATPSQKDLLVLGGGTTPLSGSGVVALPNSRAFKLVADATDGFVIFLTKAFWSVKHSGLANDGTTAATGTQFYAHGLVVPTLSYASTDGITRASIPIVSGQDEVLGAAAEQSVFAIFFKSASGAPVLLFRRNEFDLSEGRR